MGCVAEFTTTVATPAFVTAGVVTWICVGDTQVTSVPNVVVDPCTNPTVTPAVANVAEVPNP